MPVATGQLSSKSLLDSCGTLTAEIRPTWADAWQFRPDIEVLKLSVAAGGADLDACEVSYRYGRVKQPHDAAFTYPRAEDLIGQWLRVRLVSRQGLTTIWQGRIEAEQRDVQSQAARASGRQLFVAYGPVQIMRKITLSLSLWRVSGANVWLDWTPGFNAEHAGRPVGNRTTSKIASSYLFGGSSLWTRRQAAEYAVTRFLDTSDTGGPVWTLTGDLSLLDDGTDSIALGNTQTVSEVLHRLIDPRIGVDFVVLPTSDGFEVRVFSLAAETVTYAGATLRRNPNQLKLRASETTADVHTELVETEAHRYARIRVSGERIVSARDFSVEGDDLVQRWDSTLEASYKSAIGADADANDALRADELYKDVYCTLGLADGVYPRAPYLYTDGTVDMTQFETLHQLTERNTLPWLPMYAGWDYSRATPLDRNPSVATPGLCPLAVWLWHRERGTYVPAAESGLSVSALRSDWGFHLSARPNHLMAAGHFSGANPTMHRPKYDWDNTVATLAMRTDRRLALDYVIDAAREDETGEVLDLHVSGAELWVIEPNTRIGRDGGGWVRTPSTGVVVRDDSDRLARVMAGAIARYGKSRGRAVVRNHGLLPAHLLLGYILTVIEEVGGTAQQIQGPVTSVTWTVYPTPQTVVKAGHAL